MKLYSCVVRLGGEVTNEVYKHNVTAPEIIILQDIHGAGAITRVKPVGSTNRQHREERQRLAEGYTNGNEPGEAIVSRLFGPVFQKLPLEIDESAFAQNSTDQDDDEDALEDAEIVDASEAVEPAAAPAPRRRGRSDHTETLG